MTEVGCCRGIGFKTKGEDALGTRSRDGRATVKIKPRGSSADLFNIEQTGNATSLGWTRLQ
jgi:hypothetical protein